MGTQAWKNQEFSPNTAAEQQSSISTLLEQLHYQQGEKRLMLAVLRDAVNCIEGYRTGGRKQSWPAYREALYWVLTQDHTWLFSFENICFALDLNPARLRTVLLMAALPSIRATRAGTFLQKVLATPQQVRA
jgi:hypothetical protein